MPVSVHPTTNVLRSGENLGCRFPMYPLLPVLYVTKYKSAYKVGWGFSAITIGNIEENAFQF